MKRKLLVVYQGRHGQWDGMGKSLYSNEPVFKETIDKASEIVGERDNITLGRAFIIDEVASAINKNEYHAILFQAALHCALTDLWRSKGLLVDGTIGLSLGDITSTYANEIFSLEETLLVARSGALWDERIWDRGMTIIVQQGLDQIAELIESCPVRLECFAEFGPNTTLLFATRDCLEAALQFLKLSGIEHYLYQKESAYHTKAFENFRSTILSELARLSPRSPLLPYYSSFLAGRAEEGHKFDNQHFYNMLAGPVYFHSAFCRALADGYNVILNVGPHPELNSFMYEAATKMNIEIEVLDSMRNDELEIKTLNRSAERLKELGLMGVSGVIVSNAVGA